MAGKAKEIAGYTTPDKYTVVIHLDKPDMAFMGAMAMSFTDVVAKEWVEKWGRQINRHPLGTGPFMFDHWTAGREILVTRNPNYYAPDVGVPRRRALRVLAQPVHRGAQAAARRRQRARRLHPAGGVRARQGRPEHQQARRRGAGDRHRLPVPEPHREAVRQPQGAPGDQHGRRPDAHRQAAQRRRRPAHAAVSGRPARPSGRRRRRVLRLRPGEGQAAARRGRLPQRLLDHAVLAQRRPVAQGAAVGPAGPQGDRHHGRPQDPRQGHVLDADRQAGQVRRGPQRLVDGLPRPERLHHPAVQQEHGDRRGHQPELLVEPRRPRR